jgi:Ca2+:H+ antiporter
MAGISTYAAVSPGGLRNKARGGRSIAMVGEAPEPPLHTMSLVQTKKEALKVKHSNATLGRSSSDLLGPSATPLGGRTPSRAPPGNLAGLRNLLWDPISLLLVAWPLGCLAHFHDWGDIPEFWLNFIAMVPLAKILGDATEELAAGLKNDTLGGLLNATFGNAVEMILTVQTLRAGQIGVVKGTLLGSILSNLLLVLGMSFFVGGLTPSKGSRIGKEQTFSTQAALTNMTMLLLACSAFAFPAVFFSHEEIDREYNESQISELGTFAAGSTPRLLQISRWCSVYILAAYVAFLFFQLYTHVDVFKGSSGDEEEEDEEAQLSPAVAVALLFVATCLVAASSEFLVDSIDGLVDSWGLGKTFIGVILLPIVGNACEHAGAVRMAVYDKMDITIGIAVGSSTQIALFVVPFAVLVGWAIDQPMDLDLGALHTTIMMMAVLITFSVVSDGNTNWLEGFMLMIAYLVVATLFWFLPENHNAA